MTLHDTDRARKPPRRFWLFAPYAAVLIAAFGWTAVWIGVSQTVAREMDKTAARLRGEGFVMEWSQRRIDGYPFRLDVTLDDPRFMEPSGWGLAAPQLKAEAYAYSLDPWMIVAPRGVVLNRPGKGGVVVTGQVLRASVARTDTAPRIAVEGVKLTFTPQPGAQPFPVGSAARLEWHSRPLPGDRAEGMLQLDGAAAPPQSLIGRITGGRTAGLVWHGVLSNVSALHGGDWPSAVRAWSAAGGAVSLIQATLAAGPVRLQAGPDTFKVGNDGRLEGPLSLDLRAAPNALEALMLVDPAGSLASRAAAMIAEIRAGGPEIGKVDLTFQAGVTTLGPIPIAPAPKVY